MRKPRPPRVLVDRLAELGITATRQTLALRDVSVTALRKGLATLLRAEPTGSMPFTAQRGPMNEPLQMGRSIATLSLPLDEMRAVGKRFDATLNDLAVTLVDEGVHRYLRHSGRAFSHRLVAFCPVSCAKPATRVDRVTPPLANVVISNVAGVRERMYLNGAPRSHYRSGVPCRSG